MAALICAAKHGRKEASGHHAYAQRGRNRPFAWRIRLIDGIAHCKAHQDGPTALLMNQKKTMPSAATDDPHPETVRRCQNAPTTGFCAWHFGMFGGRLNAHAATAWRWPAASRLPAP